jgi:cytochrome P450
LFYNFVDDFVNEEKQSAVTSGRPRFIMGQELLSNNMRGLMAGYNDFWRRWRKILHGAFNSKASEQYKPIQSLESKQFLNDLLKDPERYRTHLERYAASVVVSVTYGRRVHDVHKDEVVGYNRDAQEYLTSVNIPGKYLVETIPALLWLPNWITPWRQEAMAQRQRDIAYLTGMVDEVRGKISHGRAAPSFCRELLEQQEKLGMTDLEVAYSCGTPFGAGVETSLGTILSFILACVAFGHSFIAEAQAELDSVVGHDRLPDFDDYDRLPFVRAVIAETLRWRPVAVLGGTPHASTEDITFRGHFIPKGSTIIAPLWSIHMNEKDFPDPHRFDPQRFMSKRDYPGPWQHSAYGWGRRVCVGQWLANNSVFINIARLLWGFDIGHAKDDKGDEIPVDIFAYTNGFNSLPMPFAASIVPRSSVHASVIRREYESARDEFREFDM